MKQSELDKAVREATYKIFKLTETQDLTWNDVDEINDNLVAKIEGMISPQWLDLDQAPKDGTEFLICYTEQGNVLKLVYWNTIHHHWSSKGEAVLGLENQATKIMLIDKANLGGKG